MTLSPLGKKDHMPLELCLTKPARTRRDELLSSPSPSAVLCWFWFWFGLIVGEYRFDWYVAGLNVLLVEVMLRLLTVFQRVLVTECISPRWIWLCLV